MKADSHLKGSGMSGSACVRHATSFNSVLVSTPSPLQALPEADPLRCEPSLRPALSAAGPLCRPPFPQQAQGWGAGSLHMHVAYPYMRVCTCAYPRLQHTQHQPSSPRGSLQIMAVANPHLAPLNLCLKASCRPAHVLLHMSPPPTFNGQPASPSRLACQARLT